MAIEFNVNGKAQKVDVDPNMPLLWVLRDTLGMTGTKFGCGMALCGACTVHVNGEPTRSCVTPISSVAGKKITTIEGLSTDRSHPVQRAWIELDVPQCGYCQSGQIMSAAALLAKHPQPTDAQIDEAMTGNICRCGTYQRIREAIHRAAQLQSAADHKPDATGHNARTCIERTPAGSRSQEVRNERHPSRIRIAEIFSRRASPAPQGSLIGFYLPGRFEVLAAARSDAASSALNAWIHIGTDDMVTIMIDKSEMGQGVMTSLSMLAAEELECDWKKVRAEFAPAAKVYYNPAFGSQGTGGSSSIRSSWAPDAQGRRNGARNADRGGSGEVGRRQVAMPR